MAGGKLKVLVQFFGIWEAGNIQVKVKASGMGKTVFGERKRYKNHLGVKEESGSQL